MTAIGQTSVPWCPIIVRNAFGVAGGAHRNPANHSTRYAWPSARWGSLPRVAEIGGRRVGQWILGRDV